MPLYITLRVLHWEGGNKSYSIDIGNRVRGRNVLASSPLRMKLFLNKKAYILDAKDNNMSMQTLAS